MMIKLNKYQCNNLRGISLEKYLVWMGTMSTTVHIINLG